MKLTTLCYPLIDGKVLLAMKKRGFGVGKWNGPGGKVEPGESIEDACHRETLEEVGIKCINLEHRGVVEFVFETNPDWDTECHIFVTTLIQGEALESEEMLPAWYQIDKIPYDQMWEDDPIWLPGVLAGGKVNLRFYFNSDGKMLHHEDR
ncbi:MAG: 8-oxo-dGTP diphosphatase [Patescibacteria group bacterium]|nr:8-oxo-dGTP diphosphatase [Patescibacteria group bacterium]